MYMYIYIYIYIYHTWMFSGSANMKSCNADNQDHALERSTTLSRVSFSLARRFTLFRTSGPGH